MMTQKHCRGQSKHLLSLIAAFIAMALAFGPWWGQVAEPVYADTDWENAKICFEDNSDYDWAYFYNIENIDDNKTLEDLDITVIDGNGTVIDPTEYDLSIEHVYYDEEKGREIGVPVAEPYGIREEYLNDGFTEYRAIATQKEDQKKWIEGRFYIMDKHTLNFVCSETSFNGWASKGKWRMHDRYWYLPAADMACSVRHTGDDKDLIQDTDYRVTYYERSADADDPNADFDEVLDTDDSKKLDGAPTQPGEYFAVIEGIAPYYGGNRVLIDIEEAPPIIIEDGGIIWSDDDLSLDITMPRGMEGTAEFYGGIRNESAVGGWDLCFTGDEYFSYDDANEKLTLHGDKIYQILDEHGYNNQDMYLEAVLKDTSTDPHTILAKGNASIEVREAIYERRFEDRDLLPGWDGEIEGEIDARIENSEYPQGRDFRLKVNDAVITAGADLIEWEPGSEGEDRWWYYRAKQEGDVTIRISYTDYDGTPETHDIHLRIRDHVYESNLWSDGNVYEALPGGEIKLNASATHKYMDGDQERETDEGLDFIWKIEEGADKAQIIEDKTDHSKARLVFNEPKDKKEFYACVVRVKMSVVDKKDQDPTGEKSAQDRWYGCRSEFYSIYPGDLNPVLDVGQSIENQKFELRHYKYGGGDGYNKDCYKTEEIEWIKWDFDENAIAVKDADGNYIEDGEEYEGIDTFTLTRTGEWGFPVHLTVGYHDEYNNDETDAEIEYWFFDRQYDIWFEDQDVNVYDDGEWTISLSTNEGLNYDALDVEYSLKCYGYDEETEEEKEIPDPPDDCWSIAKDGMSVTFFGRKMADAGIDRIWVEAKLNYGEKDLGKHADCNVELDDSCTTHGREHLWLYGVPEYKDCTSKGSMKQMCWHCHERRIVEVGPKGHKGKKIAAKASTASKEGNILYYKCNDCGKCFTDANCTKEISADLVIIPRGTVISKLAAQSKGFTVTIKKPTGTYLKHTTGYEVMYALNSKFTSGKKTVVIAKNSTVTYKVTKLTAKKKYYVRVRTYRTINGKKYYSPWSPAKAVTTK